MSDSQEKDFVELKILRKKFDKINNLLDIAIKKSSLSEINTLDEEKNLLQEKIKILEDKLYPDVIA